MPRDPCQIDPKRAASGGHIAAGAFVLCGAVGANFTSAQPELGNAGASNGDRTPQSVTREI